VVDEELKMMSKICRAGGEIRGPFLKEMSSLIHTEYLLEGKSSMDLIEALRLSMFAATMVGSPLENAARIIHKYETESRRYYSSALLLLSRDERGVEQLDSAITIRTMEVDAEGRCTIQSGASIVRDSVPEKECQEIKAKAQGLLNAIASPTVRAPDLHKYRDALVDEVLESRNRHLSRFWLRPQTARFTDESLRGRTMLIIDNEDEFTYMLKHVLEHLGIKATVREYDDPALDLAAADLVLVGPGPGDPGNLADPKMATVHGLVDRLLASGKKFLAVCLGHQILCHRLGMSLVKVDPPLQGVQKTIELFGRLEAVGFYNTFFAVPPPDLAAGIEVASEPDGTVTALRAKNFASFQFHVESVLTTNGLQIVKDAIHGILGH
jgi:phenazine biosynthesis protein phzE